MFSFREFYRNDPATLARHLDGRFAEKRERYLNHCADVGSVNSTLQKVAPVLLKADNYLDFKAKEKFSEGDLTAAVDSFMKVEFKNRREPKTTRAFHCRVVRKWCVFLDKFAPIETHVQHPFWSIADEFEDFLKEECELAPKTIRNYTRFAGYFFVWLSAQRNSLDGLSVVDVDDYFRNNACRWHRRSIRTMSHALRVLFRYLEKRNLCKSGIAEAIKSPMVFSQEDVPRGPSWDIVQKFIASENPNPCAEARDKAIVLILAIYGLRASEVRRCHLMPSIGRVKR